MDRRKVIVSGIVTGLAAGITAAGGPALAQGADDDRRAGDGSDYPRGGPDDRRDDGQVYRHDDGERAYGGPGGHPA